MSHDRKRITALAGAGFVLALYAFARAPLTPEPGYARIAKMVARVLPEAHLERLPLGDNVASNALQMFLSTLDYDHSYFLARDIEEFDRESDTLDDRLRKGDVSLAYHIFDVFEQRVSNRVAYVDTLLAQKFDLEAKESYSWKRRDAPWPADEAEGNELWRKKIKNEYLSQVVARRLAEENGEPKGTNAVAASKEGAPDAEAVATPEEAIRKRYGRFLTVIQDADSEWVLQRYLTAFALAYDPHSEYLSASATEDFDIGMKLSLVGIGALLSSEDGAAKVERIIPGGPADRDGRLKAGDKIIAVAQGDEEPVDILHWPLRKIVEKIRGEKGTRVVLTVIPAADVSGSRKVRIDLIRDEVKLEEQAAKGRAEEIQADEKGVRRKLGIVTLPAFYADIAGKMERNQDSRSSVRDVRKILADMEKQGVEGILLDLRNNGGGSLTEAVEMTGLFIRSGPVVQVRKRRTIQVLSDPDPESVYDGPLVVLVNRQSASASEILAGALQDYGRALVVGDSKTHGKGTVQSFMPLDRSDAQLGSLKVTEASFYRIAGGSTQLKGIAPDIVIPSPLDSLEIGEEFLPHVLPWSAVGPALYRPVADLQPLVTELRERSEKRREGDARFTAEKQLLDRLSALQKTREIPLNLDERMRMAREEKALETMEREAETPGGDGEKTDKDLILREALRILADAAAGPAAPGAEALPETAGK
jgi:carboxyl-terminal processing protease